MIFHDFLKLKLLWKYEGIMSQIPALFILLNLFLNFETGLLCNPHLFQAALELVIHSLFPVNHRCEWLRLDWSFNI